MPLTLCVLVTARPGHELQLAAYEDVVLVLVPQHGGRVLERLRVTDPGDGPHEVHVIEFPSATALDAYLHDPERVALADERDAAIAHTEILRVERLDERG